MPSQSLARWGDFTFERTEPEAIKDTHSVRLAIKLSYRGKRWGTVPLEVAPAEGKSGDDVETFDAIGIEQFGLEGPERVPCLGIRYQIAQKIHAYTEPPLEGKDENPRFHDPMGITLLRDLVPGDSWPTVRDACVDTFETRAKHTCPPELVVYPSWPAAFAALDEEQGFDITDVEEAARQVREMIVLIDAATDVAPLASRCRARSSRRKREKNAIARWGRSSSDDRAPLERMAKARPL